MGWIHSSSHGSAGIGLTERLMKIAVPHKLRTAGQIITRPTKHFIGIEVGVNENSDLNCFLEEILFDNEMSCVSVQILGSESPVSLAPSV